MVSPGLTSSIPLLVSLEEVKTVPGRRHLWECDHTPSLTLSDVVKLSVEGSPTGGSPGMSGEGSPASGVLTEAGGGRRKS